MGDTRNERKQFAFALGGRIRKARVEKRITQMDLAELVDLSTTSISDYETGKKVPSAFVIKKLGSALNITIDELFGFDPKEEYIKDVKEDPLGALLTVMKEFRFHVHVQEPVVHDEIRITPDTVHLKVSRQVDQNYNPDMIISFFQEYETVQTIRQQIEAEPGGEEMVKQLLLHLKEKYAFLPKCPVYEVHNNS